RSEPASVASSVQATRAGPQWFPGTPSGSLELRRALVRVWGVEGGRSPLGSRAWGLVCIPQKALLAEEDFGFGVGLWRDELQFAGRLGQRHADDLGAAQRDHRAPRLVVDRADGMHAKARRQHPVIGGGRAAALDVPEYRAARLLASALLDLGRQQLP